MSAMLLGLYGIAKKRAVEGNPIAPVLWLQVTTAAAIWMPLVWLSRGENSLVIGTPFEVQDLSLDEHVMLAMKSALVGMSWTLALFAVKHLPISISAPIRSTSPVWTILLAVSCFGESPDAAQWLGIFMVLAAIAGLSRIGKDEGIRFQKNRAVACMFAATLLGSASALYDKFLLQHTDLSPATVQAWFSLYLVLVMSPLAIRWLIQERKTKPIAIRPSIFAIAVSLLAADFAYFHALQDPVAMISVISPLRRTSVLIPFGYGILFLDEENGKRKAVCVAVMMAGAAALCS